MNLQKQAFKNVMSVYWRTKKNCYLFDNPFLNTCFSNYFFIYCKPVALLIIFYRHGIELFANLLYWNRKFSSISESSEIQARETINVWMAVPWFKSNSSFNARSGRIDEECQLLPCSKPVLEGVETINSNGNKVMSYFMAFRNSHMINPIPLRLLETTH